jgi:hypothetical protein
MSAVLSFTAYWWMRSHPAANLTVRAKEPSAAGRYEFEQPLPQMIDTFIEGLLGTRGGQAPSRM